MGRELKRKQAKREGKNVREVQKLEKEKPMTLKSLIKILIALLVIFVILYIITGLFITKDIKWFDSKKETTETTSSNKILAANSLKQKEEEYYVYYYDATDNNVELESIISKISPLYRVDLNNDFNSNFIGESSGIVDNINDLKVSNPTIIKVNNSVITGYYSGSEEIKENFK